MNRTIIFHLVMSALILALLLWKFGVFSDEETLETEFPTQPIKIVVPYPAGGGSDTFTRIVERAVVEDKLLPVPLVIQNLGGGSGTIGSREVLEAKPDGHTLLMHHNALLGVYVDEVADFGPNDFEKIALTGSMSMVVIVRGDSKFKTLKQLVETAKAEPNTVTFGANQGSQAYFTAKQLEIASPGSKFAIVNHDGGADRYASLIGGHLDAGIFALSEYLDFRAEEGTPPDQNIRVLATMAAERHPAIPEAATSTEQGFNVHMENTYYWWAPQGTPSAVVDYLATVLKKAMQNERVLSELDRLRINPEYVVGQEMLDRMETTLAGMQEAKLGGKPNEWINVPRIVMILTALLLVGVILQSLFGKVPEEELLADEPDGDHTRYPGLAAVCFGVVVLYVLLLQLGVLPWALATAAMVIVVGGLMAFWKKPQLLVILQLALLTGLGTEFLFTKVFTVILP